MKSDFRKMLIACFLSPFTLFSATYYVSNSGGSDSYTAAQAQNAATPWKSLAKINSMTFLPGDNILLKKGDSWTGTVVAPSSGSNGNPITYGAYGSGGNPMIMGTVSLTGPWTVQSGSVYWADVPQNINRLFLNGQPLVLARTPNAGYLKMDDTLNSRTLKCGALPNVNFTGAIAHVRTSHWTIASKKIISFDAAQKTVTLSAAPVYGLKPGWGFFINNTLEALDQAGEWYYDSTAHRLYVWTPKGDSPSNYRMEGSTFKNGFEISSKSFVIVRGITIFGHCQYGVAADNVSNLEVDGNVISFPGAVGVNILNGGSSHNVVDSNVIVGAGVYGVLSYGTGVTVSNNTIKRIALVPDFTKIGMGDQCCSGLAFEIHGDNAQVRNNRIDSIGYIGIRSFDRNNLIEYNFLQNCCLSKDDGGGIYTGWQSDRTAPGASGTIIRRNIVLNTRSAPESNPDLGYTPGEGIYVDDQGHDITITENTAADCSNHGFFLHNNKNMRVSNNVSYNNQTQMGLAEDAIIGPGYVTNNSVKNNIFYSLTDKQTCLRTTSPYTDTFLAVTDSNYYCNPYDDIIISYNASAYSLDSWRAAKHLDAHSRNSRIHVLPYRIASTLGPNLVANGTFQTSVSSWGYWPGAVARTWDRNHGLDSGCMKVLYTVDTAATSCLVYPSSFELTEGQAYLLKFSVISNKPGTLQAIVRQAHAPWGVIGLSKYFPFDTTRKDFSVVFYADTTDAQCRIDFSNTKADSLYWLDNVSIVPVSVVPEDPREQSKLFYNATLRDSVISLSGKGYRDLDGNLVTGSITLAPFLSRILIPDASYTYSEQRADAAEPFSLSIAPNPCNPSATISIGAVPGTALSVDCFDLRGRKILTLFKGVPSKPKFTLVWNGEAAQTTKLGSGVCFIRLSSKSRSLIRKLLIMK